MLFAQSQWGRVGSTSNRYFSRASFYDDEDEEDGEDDEDEDDGEDDEDEEDGEDDEDGDDLHYNVDEGATE